MQLCIAGELFSGYWLKGSHPIQTQDRANFIRACFGQIAPGNQCIYGADAEPGLDGKSLLGYPSIVQQRFEIQFRREACITADTILGQHCIESNEMSRAELTKPDVSQGFIDPDSQAPISVDSPLLQVPFCIILQPKIQVVCQLDITAGYLQAFAAFLK